MNKTALEAAETRSQEFARLVGEYQHGDGSEKAEAWNLIADFAVENAAVIRDALIAYDRRSPAPAPAETEEDRALANFDKIKDSFFASNDAMLSAPAEGVTDEMVTALEAAISLGFHALKPLLAALPLLPSESAEKAGVVGDGVALIAAERRRQVEREGWTAEHDDKHSRGEMAGAAATYAVLRSHVGSIDSPGGAMLGALWPWDGRWWKPTGPVRDLVKAGALIAAEIDRLQRIAPASPSPATGEA